MNIDEKFDKIDNENKIKYLLYTDIKVGMSVKDKDNNISIVLKCNDIHNILVEYINGGKGLYCLDDNCKDFDKIFICI